MPRPRKSMAQRIREMTADGKTPAKIAKAVNCTTKYVYEVQWMARNPGRRSQRRRPEYHAEYMKKRYHKDPVFREKVKGHVRKYKARKQAERRLAA